MKKLHLLFLAVTIIVSIMGARTVQAAGQDPLVCPTGSPVPCDFLTQEDVFTLETFAQEADRDQVHAFLAYKKNQWGPVFEADFYPGSPFNRASLYGVREDVVPARIQFDINDTLCITHLGACYQRGVFTVWEPTWYSTYMDTQPDGMELGTTLYGTPRQLTLAEALASTENDYGMYSYYKASPSLTLVYGWDTIVEGNTVTLDIWKVNVQSYHPTGMDLFNEYPYLPEDATVLTSEEVQALNIQRGQPVEIVQAYTNASQLGIPAMIFDAMTHVEIKLPGGEQGIISLENIRLWYQEDCTFYYHYWPTAGEQLWVTQSAGDITLQKGVVYRPQLSAEENVYLNEMLDAGKVTALSGIIIAEHWADNGTSGIDYKFDVQTAKGVVTFDTIEEDVPPVGSSVTVYQHESGSLFAIQDGDGNWWDFTFPKALWTPAETCKTN